MIYTIINNILSVFENTYPPEYELLMSYDMSNDYVHWVVFYNPKTITVWNDKVYPNNEHSVICRGIFSELDYSNILQSICKAVDKVIYRDSGIVNSAIATFNTVRVIKCPSCNAIVEYGQHKCDYCDSKFNW